MGRRLIDLSERLLFLLSSLVQSFLDIRLFLTLFSSERFLLWLLCIQRPDQVCFLLHLWEVCMSGI